MFNSSQEAVVVATVFSILAGACLFVYSTRSATTSRSADFAVLPPHVWSWIPYLGSAIAMGADVTKFIRSSSKKHGNAPVFTATILGDKCVFIADPEYLSIVFRAKYTKYLDSYSLQKQFTENVLDFSQSENKENYSEAINKETSKQFHHYLFKGQELEKSVESVQNLFHKVIPELASPTGEWTTHNSLFDMVVRAIFKATMGPIFSPTLVTDEMYENFSIFDKGVIALFNDAPNLLTQKTREAREFIFEQIQSPAFVRTCSSFMKERQQMFLDNSVADSTLRKANLGLLWASVGNSAPAIFWSLLLLLEHKDAWEACVAQVHSIVAKRKDNDNDNSNKNNDNDSVGVFTLEELDEMTLLQSAFTETLRLYQGNFTARRVVEDFVLETKHQQKYLIPKGSKLMSWWGILHRDPHIFDHPDEFRFDRFIGKSRKDFSFEDGKALAHEPVMPFGGGEQLCPGRKFVAYEMRLYLAMLIQSFDIRLVEGESRPGIDPAMVGIGVCHPNKDVKVEVRLRQSSN